MICREQMTPAVRLGAWRYAFSMIRIISQNTAMRVSEECNCFCFGCHPGEGRHLSVSGSADWRSRTSWLPTLISDSLPGSRQIGSRCQN